MSIERAAANLLTVCKWCVLLRGNVLRMRSVRSNILEDRPSEPKSRWSSNSNQPPQVVQGCNRVYCAIYHHLINYPGDHHVAEVFVVFLQHSEAMLLVYPLL